MKHKEKHILISVMCVCFFSANIMTVGEAVRTAQWRSHKDLQIFHLLVSRRRRVTISQHIGGNLIPAAGGWAAQWADQSSRVKQFLHQ